LPLDAGEVVCDQEIAAQGGDVAERADRLVLVGQPGMTAEREIPEMMVRIDDGTVIESHL
jgi:hypothetical protein